MAQANCATQNNVYTCDIPAGTYNAPIIASEPVESVVLGQGMAVTSAGVITIPSSAPASTSWGVAALAVTASGVGFPGDGDTYGLTISNQGALTLTPDLAGPVDSYIFGVLALQSAVSTGASQVGVSLDNAGAITMDLAGVQAWGGSAIWASDQGGPSGGSSAGASVTNSGAIIATATGQQGFAGIQANSWGGYLGASGSGGAASIVNSAPVTVNWTWENVGTTNNGVLGLQALSQGSNGGDNPDGYGGSGGGAGSASVTLNPGGDVSVGVSGSPPSTSAQSAGVLAAVIGGSGGAGAGGSSYGGGNGAGLGELAAITVNGANVQTTGDLLPGLSLLMLAGAGGNGGCQNNTGCDFSNTSGDETGGYGGQVTGPATIAVSAVLGPVTLSTTGAQSAAIQALQAGGLGGGGGDDVTVGGGTGAGGLGGGGGAGSARSASPSLAPARMASPSARPEPVRLASLRTASAAMAAKAGTFQPSLPTSPAVAAARAGRRATSLSLSHPLPSPRRVFPPPASSLSLSAGRELRAATAMVRSGPRPAVPVVPVAMVAMCP